MNVLDLALGAALLLWTVHGLARGIIRAIVGLAAWLVGIVAALHLAAPVAALLPAFGAGEGARFWIAFIVVLVGVLVAGALVGAALARLARAIGLGWVDRVLGAVFGLACGALFALVLAFIAGLTGMAKRDWWQNSFFGPVLSSGVLALAPWLPPAWAGRLDYPGRATPQARPGLAV